jgi:hypothetical protein
MKSIMARTRKQIANGKPPLVRIIIVPLFLLKPQSGDTERQYTQEESREIRLFLFMLKFGMPLDIGSLSAIIIKYLII